MARADSGPRGDLQLSFPARRARLPRTSSGSRAGWDHHPRRLAREGALGSGSGGTTPGAGSSSSSSDAAPFRNAASSSTPADRAARRLHEPGPGRSHTQLGVDRPGRPGGAALARVVDSVGCPPTRRRDVERLLEERAVSGSGVGRSPVRAAGRQIEQPLQRDLGRARTPRDRRSARRRKSRQPAKRSTNWRTSSARITPQLPERRGRSRKGTDAARDGIGVVCAWTNSTAAGPPASGRRRITCFDEPPPRRRERCEADPAPGRARSRDHARIVDTATPRRRVLTRVATAALDRSRSR